MRLKPFTWLMFSSSALILLFIFLPLGQMVFSPTLADLEQCIADPEVRAAIGLSLYTSGLAALISLLFGTPLAYLLARKKFRGKRLLEAAVDLPIMIPHPVIGIAILGLAGKAHPLGRFMQEIGIEVMGTVTGLVTVLTFVGLPFFINSARDGFLAVPERLEKTARSLGSGPAGAFLRVTLPLAWRPILSGLIMCMARAISEFGAVVIVAYHPMTAPVMIYERFAAYGLKYSQPVAVWLILVSLLLFACLRILSFQRSKAA